MRGEHKHHPEPTDANLLTQATGQPGKRPRTSSLPGTKPTEPTSPKEDTSYLTEHDRVYTRIALGENVIIATACCVDAINDARIEQLTRTEEGWGFLADFLFYGLSGPLASLGMKGALWATGQIAERLALDPARILLAAKIANSSLPGVEGILTNGLRASRGALKAAFHGKTEDGQAKAEFLRQMRGQVHDAAANILAGANKLEDAELEAAALGWGNRSIHNQDTYGAMITEKLASYDRNRLGQVGKVEESCRRIGQDYGCWESDRGRLEWTDTTKATLRMVDQRGATQVLDPEWNEYAVKLYAEKTGKTPREPWTEGWEGWR